MEFFFDLGYAPEFEVKLDETVEVENYSIKVEDDLLDKYIDETQRRFGEYTHPDEATDTDMVSGEAVQVNAEGQPVEGGIKKNVFFTLEKMKEEKAKKALLSLKKGETITFNPLEFLGSTEEAVQQLGLKAEEVSVPDLQLNFTLGDIVHLVPAELNSDLFEKVYPGQDIKTNDDFRARVRQEAGSSFTAETDKVLLNEMIDVLVKNTTLPLPDDFLKHWLKDNDEKPFSDEEIEKQYPAFAESMRWQLIENKIIVDNHIEVKDEDIRNYIRTVLLRQMDADQPDPEKEKRYEAVIDAFMQNK